jgi:hypothetical protein
LGEVDVGELSGPILRNQLLSDPFPQLGLSSCCLGLSFLVTLYLDSGGKLLLLLSPGRETLLLGF